MPAIDKAHVLIIATNRFEESELFGPRERWGATTHSFQWARVDSLVPSFTGSTMFSVEVPCTYDLEVASAKYFDSLGSGVVPQIPIGLCTKAAYYCNRGYQKWCDIFDANCETDL